MAINILGRMVKKEIGDNIYE
jgi:hypothetical protein